MNQVRHFKLLYPSGKVTCNLTRIDPLISIISTFSSLVSPLFVHVQRFANIRLRAFLYGLQIMNKFQKPVYKSGSSTHTCKYNIIPFTIHVTNSFIAITMCILSYPSVWFRHFFENLKSVIYFII